MTNPYTDKAADLVTKLFRTGEHINGTVIWEPTEMVATALQEAAQGAWQPIETAPKAETSKERDLTLRSVLVFHPQANPQIYVRLSDGDWWRGLPDLSPTHWMPLPTPPKGDA